MDLGRLEMIDCVRRYQSWGQCHHFIGKRVQDTKIVNTNTKVLVKGRRCSKMFHWRKWSSVGVNFLRPGFDSDDPFSVSLFLSVYQKVRHRCVFRMKKINRVSAEARLRLRLVPRDNYNFKAKVILYYFCKKKLMGSRQR